MMMDICGWNMVFELHKKRGDWHWKLLYASSQSKLLRLPYFLHFQKITSKFKNKLTPNSTSSPLLPPPSIHNNCPSIIGHSLGPNLYLIRCVLEISNQVKRPPPHFLRKGHSANLKSIIEPAQPICLWIASHGQQTAVMDLARRFDLHARNGDFVALEVEVHELNLMVVVDAEHVPGAYSEAKALACELKESDFEGDLFCNFQAGDEVDPGVAVYSFDPQSICTLAVGKTSVVRVLGMWLNQHLPSSSHFSSLQLMPQLPDFLILLPQFLLQPLLQQPDLYLVSLVPRHLFSAQLDDKPFLLVLELQGSV